ncbi:phosphate butyryltransferase [bacterium]|nr:phosphate butyryltransferase [FCB group bacterium]MBL7190341.1 phosphate butyryltransferase [bacterium]
MSVTFANIWSKADKIAADRGPTPMLVLGRRDEYSMKALTAAKSRGWITPILAYHRMQIEERKTEPNFDDSEMEIITSSDTDKLVSKAVNRVRELNGIIMRGSVPIHNMLKGLLQPGLNFVPKGELLTHIGFFESDKFPHIIMVTDGGVIIKPTLKQKTMIVKNACEAARKIGISKPRVAMLAAVESVYLTMPEALDDAVIAKMADRGTFGEAYVDGPLSFDVAIVPHAAKEKKVGGEVAGKADILVVSRIEVGNGLYKSLFMFGNARSGGVIYGGAFPVVMTSRSQQLDSKMNSIALALMIKWGG